MAEYIDRQEVIETVAFYREDPDGVDHALNSIKSVPSADVAPVVHGLWKWSEGGQCSECGFHNSNFGYDYCPNCGAKMDGEA